MALPDVGVDIEAIKQQVEETVGAPVAGVLMQSDQMLRLGSSAVFIIRFPNHAYMAERRRRS